MSSIESENYQVNSQQGEIMIKGILRLNGLDEYQPIVDILEEQLFSSDKLTLNLKELKFLNSSGIAMLSKFVINVRKSESKKLTIIGSKNELWQGKSLINLKRLFPALELIIE